MKKFNWIPAVSVGVVFFICAFFAIVELSRVSANGVVKARDIRSIMIDFPAMVDSVQVYDGQRVKQGDVLFTINIKDYEALINAKKQDLNNAKYDLQKESARVRMLENELLDTRSLLSKSEKELTAKEKLLQMGAISENEVEEMRKKVLTTRMQFSNLSIELSSESGGSGGASVLRQKIVMLESEIKNLSVKVGKKEIMNSNIIFPMKHGVVYGINYVQGDLLDSRKKVLTLLNLDSTYIEARVPETAIRSVKPGAVAYITPLSDVFKRYTGRVTNISALAMTSNDETFFLVDIALNKRDDGLLPNQNVDVKIRK